MRGLSRRLPAAILAGALAAAHAEVRPWQPKGISSAQFESHAAFDPWNGDLYFVRSSPSFEGWRILISHCGPQGWTEPVPPPFAAEGVEADPFFSSDGRSLYFISSRSITGDGVARKDLDLWRVDRTPGSGWGVPVRLPEPVNSSSVEWFPRPSADGWLYFGSRRPGGQGGNDIWRAREQGGRWVVENLGPEVNTPGDEYEALPSHDGQRLIVMASDGLYETHKTASGWSPRVKLPPEVNVNGSEIGALFSPSGKSLLFARDTKGPLSGEFFVWHPDHEKEKGGHEAWPPDCPRAKSP